VAPCMTVQISGATDNTDCNGNYDLDESFSTHCSGRETWSRYDYLAIGHNSNTTAFIYYLEDGYDGWVVGKYDEFSLQFVALQFNLKCFLFFDGYSLTGASILS